MSDWIERLLAYATPRIRMRSDSGVQLGQVDGNVTVVNVYVGNGCDRCQVAKDRDVAHRDKTN